MSKLPNVSVVIAFHDESLSMLLRTIHSVLNRSPDILLVEVGLLFISIMDDYLFGLN